MITSAINRRGIGLKKLQKSLLNERKRTNEKKLWLSSYKTQFAKSDQAEMKKAIQRNIRFLITLISPKYAFTTYAINAKVLYYATLMKN